MKSEGYERVNRTIEIGKTPYDLISSIGTGGMVKILEHLKVI